MSRDLFGRSSDDNRSAASDLLLDTINLETTNRIAVLTTLQSNVDSEAATRLANDTLLQM